MTDHLAGHENPRRDGILRGGLARSEDPADRALEQPAPDDDHVDDAVLALVLACGGTISAEHGIGVAKARGLERTCGRDDVRAMRAVKAALDPLSLLNPGVVLPPASAAPYASPG